MIFLQITHVGSTLSPNMWYNVTVTNLRYGNIGIELLINDVIVSISTHPFTGLDFNVLNGPLFIGGHQSLQNIEVNYAK